MSAISIQNLSKTYRGKRGAKVNALKDLTLQVEKGEIFGFLGPNGAGKSTTIKTLMGLIRPSSGNASIMGKEIASTEARRHVGFLPENPAFYDYLSAEEYLAFVGRTFGMNAAVMKEKIESVLKRLELWNARKRPMRGYSKGMVQRLGIAQVLVHDPQVYILDEPMSGLDPLGRSLVKEIIKELKEAGKTVFFSTHIISDVELVCDRVGILVGGHLKTVRPVQEILAAGVVGYQVKAHQIPQELVGRYGVATPTGEIHVPKAELGAIMAQLQAEGVSVELVEPRRKDLEAFFLDIVAQSVE